jgi:uncharacterized protein (DUF1330 family)
MNVSWVFGMVLVEGSLVDERPTGREKRGDLVMAAYVIVDIDVSDPVGYADYKELAHATVALYGGKYIARGGKSETLEGNWPVNRLVILEFPSMEQAKSWLNSPEYAPARALRHKYANSKMVVIEGVG